VKWKSIDAVVDAREFFDASLDVWYEAVSVMFDPCSRSSAPVGCRVPYIDRRGRTRSRAARVEFTGGGKARNIAAHFWRRSRTHSSTELEALWYRHGSPHFIVTGVLVKRSGGREPFTLEIDFPERTHTISWGGGNATNPLEPFLPLDDVLKPIGVAVMLGPS
jgi:hypothetical protein